MSEVCLWDVVHVGVMGFVDRAGDVPRDRLDLDALREPETERRRNRLTVSMDRTSTAAGCPGVLEAGTPALIGWTCLRHELEVSSVRSSRSLYRSNS